MSIDWPGITSLAYQSLINMDISSFPIPIAKIKCPGVKIASYQKYSSSTGTPIDEITQGGSLEDAFVLRNIRPGVSIILYNEDTYDPRKKHSILHEVGHVKCQHRHHGDVEETEAHYFASQVNAPNAIIKAVASRGYKVDISFLQRIFGISQLSAQKRIGYLQRHPYTHSNEYDDILIFRFHDYIEVNFPYLGRAQFDSYFDSMEDERKNWY